MKAQRYAIIDYETRAKISVTDVGAFEYAKHESTRVMCASWRVGTKEELREQLAQSKRWRMQNPSAPKYTNPHNPKRWSPAFPNKNALNSLTGTLADPDIILVAHNALFEKCITRFVLSRYPALWPVHEVAPERWHCTAASSAALALPRSLAGSCDAIGADIRKDLEGNRLMKKLARPRKPTKNNPAVWHSNPNDLLRVMDYCDDDVDAETIIFLTNEDLSPHEREVWLLDQVINSRGFAVDRELVKTALQMIEVEVAALASEAHRLTKGEIESTNQRAKLKDWLDEQGVYLENLQKKTIEDAMKAGVKNPVAKRVLEIRLELSKTSTAKYEAFEMRTRTDGRLRDHTLYHGASTGRMVSVGAQIHNIPQGRFVADQVGAADLVKLGDLELIRAIYGNPMEVFSAVLRAVIIASPGFEMFAGDFNAVEARVLFWLSGHEDGLDAFITGRDLYREMAVRIFDVPLAKVTDAMREVGKRAVLGCGFGMGAPKFEETCEKYGDPVGEEVALKAVKAYRSVHWPVPKMWTNIERAAIAAVKARGKAFSINKTKWFMRGDYLKCELPSGRLLSYYKPEVKFEMWRNSFSGEKRAVLYHWDVDPKTKQWVFVGTYGGRLVENVVQAVARDLMVWAQLRLERRGFQNLLSVHDELILEALKGKFTLEYFEKTMAEVPEWASGCPVKVKGWIDQRYHK